MLASTLFSMMLSAPLIDALKAKGFKLNYETDGGLFNTSRMKDTTKVKTDKIREVLYADDCAFCAHNEPDMQQVVEDFSAAVRASVSPSTLRKLTLFIYLFPARPG